MGEKKKIITKADGILIFCLFLLALASFFLLYRRGEAGELYVSVQLDGKEVERLPLDQGEKVVRRYETAYGINEITLKNGRVSVTEADCPDQLCLKQGWIGQEGEMLVCLPHHFLVQICSYGANKAGFDAILH